MDNYDDINIGRIYQHFKGNLYLVTGVSTNAETEVEEIEYTALYGECKKYTRAKSSFTSARDKHGELIIGRHDNVTGQSFCFVLVTEEYKTTLGYM